MTAFHALLRDPATFGLLLGLTLLTGAVRAEDEYSAEDRSHWSLLPRQTPQVPQFGNALDRAQVRNPVDAFLLVKLREQGLRPAAEADGATLVRRLYFDLTGLPPAPADIDAFLSDPAEDRYERLIERLLASPHYGEQWGQHWLDLVRYAESEGFEYDRPLPGAWRYRDYVVRAFQEDKAYDQFLREQLAGDEFSPATEDSLVAAGFLRLGPVRRNAGNALVAFSRNEVLTEMIDTVGVAFIGLTVGCARCHDHMFDAFLQKDYYRLQAFLASTHDADVSLADAARQAEWKARTDRIGAEVKSLEAAFENATGETRAQLQAQLKAVEKKLPPPLPTILSVRNDAAQRTAIHVLKRGLEDKPGEPVGPRAPGVLLADGAPEFPADVDNPRTRLADWMTEPGNPLTARVIVNRVWLQHFGRGIVNTPNDFGINGEHPSHPELLDFLANELVASGWRIKSLHRIILQSHAYRQTSHSGDSSVGRQLDPENRLLWQFPRRRLEAEVIRDAMLHVSGRLNSKAGGPSVMVPVDPDLVDLLYKPAQWTVTEDASEHDRRSIYLVAKRNLRLPFLEVFDQPALQSSCPKRESSTHAPQALELLNGAFSHELAQALAARMEHEAGPDRLRQIDLAFRLVTGRPATEPEQRLAREFLEHQPLTEFALAMFNLNDFLYVK